APECAGDGSARRVPVLSGGCPENGPGRGWCPGEYLVHEGSAGGWCRSRCGVDRGVVVGRVGGGRGGGDSVVAPRRRGRGRAGSGRPTWCFRVVDDLGFLSR